MIGLTSFLNDFKNIGPQGIMGSSIKTNVDIFLYIENNGYCKWVNKFVL